MDRPMILKCNGVSGMPPPGRPEAFFSAADPLFFFLACPRHASGNSLPFSIPRAVFDRFSTLLAVSHFLASLGPFRS